MGEDVENHPIPTSSTGDPLPEYLWLKRTSPNFKEGRRAYALETAYTMWSEVGEKPREVIGIAKAIEAFLAGPNPEPGEVAKLVTSQSDGEAETV